MLRILKWIIRDWWVVRRCCFPYPEGYATYNPFRNTILDTGLPKWQAKEICRVMNGLKPTKPEQTRTDTAKQVDDNKEGV